MRKRDSRKRRREEADKREEERQRAFKEAELEHDQEHEKANNLLDKYPSLHLKLETENAVLPRRKGGRNDFNQDVDFVIEPRFKNLDEYEHVV